MPTPREPLEFSVVVPVYESDASLRELVSRTCRTFDEDIRASFEIVLVDDASIRPETEAVLRDLASEEPRVLVIRLMRNVGKPGAVLCGLEHARGQWVVTIDDDLQQRPEDICLLAEHRDHDVVVGTYQRVHHSLVARVGGRVKNLFDRRILGLPFRMSPLKLIRRQVVDHMLGQRTGRPYIPALLNSVTHDFKAVPLEHQPSAVAGSRYDFGRRLRQFNNLIISNSGFFGRLWLYLGSLSAGVGVVLLLSLVIGTSELRLLLAAVLIVGGLILVALGVVGEYLIRLVELSSHRPPYSVRERFGVEALPDTFVEPARASGDAY